ncbi:phage antirepressor Ant [Clostridium tetani]|uniref:Rha family transcriptional regulator n=1 Tax=Clostridium tetani TaxID=1513 RepID=UPI00100A8BD2|nr:Rha family transcriptional regulator [Clostridium tetani]RXI55512.1 phage antirepressor Ant [Clostridium tetani]RXM70835.1 phage antirepressor Ant [Clostridium tetani]
MSNLIKISNKDGQLVVSSRQVGKDFEKRHNDVVRTIEEKIKTLTTENFTVNNLFIPSSFNHNGNEYKEYLLTRDGFTFIVMGFTGAKADGWKLKYIEAFNKMEKTLKEPKQLSPLEQLRLQYEVIEEQQEKLEEHDKEINDIKEKIESLEVSPFQKRQLMKARNKRVMELIGGKKSQAYQDASFRSKVYAELSRQYNNYFEISGYEYTPKNKFEEAKDVIEIYSLSTELAMELRKINSQVRF